MSAESIVAFLRARLGEDERAAKMATPGSWSSDSTGTVCADADLRSDGEGGEILPPDGPMEVAECYRNERTDERGHNAEHIARHDPARILREVEAKRRRLGRHSPRQISNGRTVLVMCDWCSAERILDGEWPCEDIRDDLAVFSDHPDYLPGWAPG